MQRLVPPLQTDSVHPVDGLGQPRPVHAIELYIIKPELIQYRAQDCDYRTLDIALAIVKRRYFHSNLTQTLIHHHFYPRKIR